jgi:DNA-binding response OmpR family regulator
MVMTGLIFMVSPSHLRGRALVCPLQLRQPLMFRREKDGESMAFATHEYHAGSVHDRVHPVSARRQTEDVIAIAARRSTGVVVDPHTREARVRGHAVALTHQEFDLLQLLVTNRDVVWSRAMLLDAAWKGDPYVTVRTVEVVVAAVRQKIEIDPANPQLILGTAQSGYWLAETA